MKLYDLFDEGEFTAALEAGHVRVQTHPDYGYRIFNYGPTVQYERAWTHVTRTCRGLIVDANDTVIARPFEKFFNYTEVPQPQFALDNAPDMYQMKEDGSLGILYPTPDGTYAVATRGSFASDQAQWATKHYGENHQGHRPIEGVTDLVEIVYPQNRIVVDYSGLEALVMLGQIDIETGADRFDYYQTWDGVLTDTFDLDSLDEAHHLARSSAFDDSEGLVVTWVRYKEPSFRFKIKNGRYVQLHKLFTQASSRTIWQSMRDGESLDEMLDVVPDEFYDWVRKVQSQITESYTDLLSQIDLYYTSIEGLSKDRKAFAEAAKKTPFPGLMFALLDGKDISSKVWDMIEPEYELPFANSGKVEQ